MKKNIGIIIPSLRNGGAERVASNLTKDLIDFYNIYLIVFDTRDITYDYEGTMIDINMPPQKTKIGKIINVLKRSRAVRKVKKKYNLECCISLLEGANLVNVLSKRKEKVITSERCLVSFLHNSFLAKKEIKYISKKADKIVSLSNLVKKDLVDFFNVEEDKIVTIYNSCDKDRLLKLASKEDSAVEKFDKNKKYILTMGRLEYQKGQWHLIKAFKKVKSEMENVELLILGQGNLQSKLEELTKKLQLEDSVRFLGYIKNPHNILKECDIFVFSSLAEGLGNVLLEALAFDRTIISTDCDAGPREILAPDTQITKKTNEIELAKYGVLVPSFGRENIDINDLEISENEKIMADAIIKILSEKDLKENYERNAKERIENFSPKKIKEEWKTLIEQLMKG